MNDRVAHVVLRAERHAELDRDAWHDLERVAGEDVPAREVAAALAPLRADLARLGVPDDAVERIHTALESGVWEPAVEGFCRQRGLPFNFYVGPMRAMEDEPLALGMLLLRRSDAANAIVKRVEAMAATLGRRTFGFPCSVASRNIELYDVVLGAGPFMAAEGRYAALFAPAYLGVSWPPAQHGLHRRSVLLGNLFRARFDALTRPTASKCLAIDGAPPAFVGASDEDIDEAIALWLTMHEMLHASGPLPLFGAAVRKIPLGLAYAGVEEMRADMTTWLMLHVASSGLPECSTIARDIILAERLVRSPRCALLPTSPPFELRRDVDGEHGALWLAALLGCGALTVRGDMLDLDLGGAERGIRELLGEVYEWEATAAALGEDGPSALVELAGRLRRRFFGAAEPTTLEVPGAASFLASQASLPNRLRYELA